MRAHHRGRPAAQLPPGERPRRRGGRPSWRPAATPNGLEVQLPPSALAVCVAACYRGCRYSDNKAVGPTLRGSVGDGGSGLFPAVPPRSRVRCVLRATPPAVAEVRRLALRRPLLSQQGGHAMRPPLLIVLKGTVPGEICPAGARTRRAGRLARDLAICRRRARRARGYSPAAVKLLVAALSALAPSSKQGEPALPRANYIKR